LAGTYRAPIKSCDFVVWLAGPTGVFKSEEAALAQQHVGANMNSRRLPGNFASTGNSLEVLAFATKGANQFGAGSAAKTDSGADTEKETFTC
jgi:hypothetical protein